MTDEWQPCRGVRASAGSGKTYQLTGHYLRALLAGAPVGELMATTFTRKATGEILDRVLTRLGEACESGEKLRALGSDLGLPNLDASLARAQMKRLCESLDEVSISTIDALFGRLLRGYRHELGLGADLRMEDANSPEMLRLRQDAAADLLAGAHGTAVAGLLDILAEGEPGRSVIGNLLAWVGRGYELFSCAAPNAWELDLETDAGARLTDEQMGRALGDLERLTSHANGHVSRAVLSNLDAAYAQDWAAFLDKGLGKALLAGAPTFQRVPLAGELTRAYAPLVGHARSSVVEEHLSRHAALRDLLALYDDAYRKRRAQTGVLLFSDVPGLLAGIVPGRADVGAVYRLGLSHGHAARHLLLDEFQDTDPRQYAILKPLAEAAASFLDDEGGCGSLFCVGDVKQSIYGWRGATPQLFDRIEREIPRLAWSDSDVSYRSSPAVLHCVNTLFGGLTSNAVLIEKAPAAAAEWQRRFREHTSSRPDLAGYVELLQCAQDAFPAGPEEEQDAPNAGDAFGELAEKAGPNLRQAAEKVKAILDHAPGRSIAVLTRTNAAVCELLPLLAALGVPAVSESGSPLDDCPATVLVLSALSFADHPGDTAARFSLTNSPLAETLHLSLAGADALSPAEAALQIRAALTAEGYAGVIGRWMDILAPQTDRRGVDSLVQLVELADEWDAARPGWHRPAEFVEWAKAQTCGVPAVSTGDTRMRVMTVHKSKGLEFDVVVLPELSKRLLRPESMVFRRDMQTQEIAALTLRPGKAVRASCPELDALALESEAQQTAEALCLLYVALTRARYALHLLVPALELAPSGKPKAAAFSLASIVRAGLVGEEALTDLGLPETLWRHGNADWHRSVPMRETAPVLPPMSRLAPAVDQSDIPPRGLQQKATLGSNTEVPVRLTALELLDFN